ncbi:hypothetical protein BJ508DRAFT_418494 [Ascobolus immersus RN42]|uniref:Prion-inhibition and propagation HeLo domain-containing protein n=1 Tax=Ascobolus immersus RN42 TaxID=1160509 RepID=A0A3N4HLL4_ASCIM|nr:hypothetical protein BJ508DRAFT_418494 [Ascobolus immersus RN42]
MAGLEIAGLALAGPTVVAQLVHTSLEGYRIFSEVQKVGGDLVRYQHTMDIQRNKLSVWEQQIKEYGKDLSELLDETQYLLTLRTLVYIAAVFADLQYIEQKYKISPAPGLPQRAIGPAVRRDEAQYERKASSEKLLVPSPKLSGSKRLGRLKGGLKRVFRGRNGDQEISVSRGTSFDGIEEKALIANTCGYRPESVAESAGEAAESQLYGSSPSFTVAKFSDSMKLQKDDIEAAAASYQQTIRTVRQFEWVLSAKDQLEKLVSDLKELTKDLYDLTSNIKGLQTVPTTPFEQYKPPLRLPFSRNPAFSGREDVMAKLSAYFQFCENAATRKEWLLVGMGGLGKSQIALEYAFRSREKYDTVVWLNVRDASTVENFALQVLGELVSYYASKTPGCTDYSLVAKELDIPGQLDTRTGQLISGANKSATLIVREWLSREQNAKWLLILDNFDSPGDLNMKNVLPACEHGHILITSRVRKASDSFSPTAEIMEVPDLDMKAGILLLVITALGPLNCEVEHEEKSAARDIVEKLGRLPLAISQAGSFIKKKKTSFLVYLRRLSHNLAKFLFEPFESSQYVYKEGVVSCWRLSLSAVSKDAVRLLNVCAFLANEAIHKELLVRGLGGMSWFERDEERLEMAIDDLIEYCLIKERVVLDSGERLMCFWIHPLLQYWVRENLEDGEMNDTPTGQTTLQRAQNGRASALRLVASTIRFGMPETMAEIKKLNQADFIYERRISPHVDLCRSYALSEWEDLSGTSAFLLGNYIRTIAAYDRYRADRREYSQMKGLIKMCKASHDLFSLKDNLTDDEKITKSLAEYWILDTFTAHCGIDIEELYQYLPTGIAHSVEGLLGMVDGLGESGFQSTLGIVILRGNVYRQLGRFLEALEICTDLLQSLDDKGMKAHLWRGSAYRIIRTVLDEIEAEEDSVVITAMGLLNAEALIKESGWSIRFYGRNHHDHTCLSLADALEKVLSTGPVVKTWGVIDELFRWIILSLTVTCTFWREATLEEFLDWFTYEGQFRDLEFGVQHPDFKPRDVLLGFKSGALNLADVMHQLELESHSRDDYRRCKPAATDGMNAGCEQHSAEKELLFASKSGLRSARWLMDELKGIVPCQGKGEGLVEHSSDPDKLLPVSEESPLSAQLEIRGGELNRTNEENLVNSISIQPASNEQERVDVDLKRPDMIDSISLAAVDSACGRISADTELGIEKLEEVGNLRVGVAGPESGCTGLEGNAEVSSLTSASSTRSSVSARRRQDCEEDLDYLKRLLEELLVVVRFYWGEQAGQEH